MDAILSMNECTELRIWWDTALHSRNDLLESTSDRTEWLEILKDVDKKVSFSK